MNYIKKNYPNKYSKADKEQLMQMLSMPKPKVNYNKVNFDFNFSKYEDIIKYLEKKYKMKEKKE